jgi:hypothetical protein
MMTGMRRRVLVWAGAGIAVVAIAGLGVYLASVGLDDADKLASVIGLFVALAGLGVAGYGLIADRRSGSRSQVPQVSAQPNQPPAKEGDSGQTSSARDRPVQRITASAPGATAQGAMFGNVINYGGTPVSAPPPSPDSPTDQQTSKD